MRAGKTTDTQFEEMGLTAPEIKLWQAIEADEYCIFDPDSLDKDRILRGEILGKILRREAIKGVIPPSLPRQLRLGEAIISGEFDMSDTDTGLALHMGFCRFDVTPNFGRARFALLNFVSSEFKKGADFHKLETRDSLWFEGVKCEGKFSLSGAKIGGQFAARRARFMNAEEDAIYAQGAEIKDSVFLNGAEVTGVASFHGAKIGGELSVKGARFINPEGDAINAQGTVIKGGVFLSDAKFTGVANFNGAKIGGQFTAKEARFMNPQGHAIHAQSAEIKGGVFLDDSKVTGVVRFNSAKIGGALSASGKDTCFFRPNGDAINAQGAEIREGVFLSNAKFAGVADFSSAKIGWQFAADGARFMNPEGDAIFAQDAVIKGGVFLNAMPHPPIGEVDFTNARLGHMVIDQNSYPLGELSLDGTLYHNIDVAGKFGDAVPAEAWLRRPVKRNPIAKVETYMALKKFYKADYPLFSNDDILEKWNELLERSNRDGYVSRSPLAYLQFARVLERHGHEGEAKNIRIEAGHDYTRRALESDMGGFAWLYRFWRFLFRRLTAYGLKPALILNYLGLLWIFGANVFFLNTQNMTPAKEKFYLNQVHADGTYKEISPSDPLPKGYPNYSPIIYALDVMLPVVDFAQESHWRPKNVEPKKLNWLRFFNRLYLAFGWAFSTIAVLGFTGLIRDRLGPD